MQPASRINSSMMVVFLVIFIYFISGIEKILCIRVVCWLLPVACCHNQCEYICSACLHRINLERVGFIRLTAR